MVMVINQRIKRVLLENKAQYIGSTVLIVFSCFMFTLMTHFAMNFERLANEFQDRHIQEDASFTTAARIDDLQELESATNTVIEEGMTLDYTLADGKRLRIFSRNDRVNIPAIVEGNELSNSGDILISPIFADTHDYKIGDEVRILAKSFTITGFMALPNYIYPVQAETDLLPLPDFGVAVISKEDFAALDRGSSFYAVKYSQADGANSTRSDQSAHAQALQFREVLTSRGIEIVQWTDIENNRRVSIVAAEVDILNLVSKAIPTAILLLASIMVANVTWRLTNRESAIIGALYALGYRRSEIYRHYLIFPLLIAIVGGIVGTLLGTFPIRAMVSFMLTAFIMPLTTVDLEPSVIIMSLLLPIGFLGGSGYFVIRKELSHSPVELMRGAKEKHKVNPLERMLKLDGFPFATKFKIREQLRSLSRLAFLLFGIAVSTMLLLWGFALKGSMDSLMTTSLTSTYHFVYEYKFDSLRYAPLPAGAEPFTAAFFLPEGDDRRDFYVTGIVPDSDMLTLVDESGARLSMDQVIVTKPLARQLEWKQGDTVNIVRKTDGRLFSVPVEGIADTYAGRFIFMPLADYNTQFEMPAGSYVGAFTSELLDIPANEPYSVVSMAEKVAGFEAVMAPTEAMVGVLATVAFIIGVIVIYVVTTLIVEENRNIISLMKILGYRKKEINSLILNSSTIIVVIGYLIGIPLVLAGLGVLIQSMEETVGLTLPPARISPLYLLVGFIVVMLSYELSKLLCRKKVDAIPMSDALKAATE